VNIRQVFVKKLFGIFDHSITLNTDDRITIIHGPNGFGKTAILRMINGFFNSQYSVFRTIPFEGFCIQFDDGTLIRITKSSTESEKDQTRGCITITLCVNGSKPKAHKIREAKDTSDIDLPIGVLDDIIPGLERVGSKKWVYIPTGEPLSLSEVMDRFEHILPLKARRRQEPEWLKKIRDDVNVRLIESQRLLNFVPSRSSRLYSRTSSMLPTVSAYSEEIAELIQSKLAEYGTISQSLDRTFPARVVQQHSSPELTGEEIREQLNQLEETRSRLIEIGLLDRDENSNFQIPEQSMDDSAKNILSVYVEDVEKKLSVFDEMANKIELLRRIINEKFKYSYKEVNFSKEKGFLFKSLYRTTSTSTKTDTLAPTDLSSGEQHELVLLYELLFKVAPNSLVLIDEPELSLHVGWQSKFLKDLQEITKLADLDICMATHSPDIIQDRWDLTVELKRPE